MQSTLLAPEPQVDESSVPRRTITAGAAVVAGAASLETALLTDATLLSVGLAVLAIVLVVASLPGARDHRGRLIAIALAAVLSLGSLGTLALTSGSAPAEAAPAPTDAVASEVSGSPVEVSVGAVTTNEETKTTSVQVTVTNVSDHSVSTWASIAATSPNGKKTYAAQGVGVRDLGAGETSTQQIQFGAVLPERAVFVVKDVL